MRARLLTARHGCTMLRVGRHVRLSTSPGYCSDTPCIDWSRVGSGVPACTPSRARLHKAALAARGAFERISGASLRAERTVGQCALRDLYCLYDNMQERQ